MMLKIFLSVIYQVKEFLEDASRDAETLEKQKCLRPSSVPIKACIFEALGGPPAASLVPRLCWECTLKPGDTVQVISLVANYSC